jgi:lipopolysaccharide biosynthesis glycosyltransferase
MPQENTHQTTDLHIAFGIDSHYLPPMAAALASLSEKNHTLSLHVHVIAEGLPTSDRTQLVAFAQSKNIGLTLHSLAAEKLADLPEPPGLTYATYYRLFLCDALKGIASRVLYLDADLLCLGDVSPLASLDMKGCTIAAVADFDQESRKAKALLDSPTPYFNAGVLLIDVERWNACAINARTLEILRKDAKRLPMFDQDALNIALAGQVLYLDRRWNSLFDHFPVLPETVFLHYAGGKPWQMWSPNYRDTRFVAALAQTPWANWHYRPTNRKQKNKQAQCYMRSGRFIKAAYWYALFLFDRKKKKMA